MKRLLFLLALTGCYEDFYYHFDASFEASFEAGWTWPPEDDGGEDASAIDAAMTIDAGADVIEASTSTCDAGGNLACEDGGLCVKQGYKCSNSGETPPIKCCGALSCQLASGVWQCLP